jgi:hypothetical protein
VIPRRLLVPLVLAIPVLVVTLATLACASWVAEGMQDLVAGRALRWVATGAGLMLLVDAILLLTALGVNAVQEDSQLPGE